MDKLGNCHAPQAGKWSQSAIDCLNKNCDCRNCEINFLYFLPEKKQCFMKDHVISTIKKIGLPKNYERKEAIL